ncbi:hypothetical protein VSR69_40850 [Paraburkholderia phytofirmans]
MNGAVESLIEEFHGNIDVWTMVRRVGDLEHKIVVTGLSERQARTIRDELKGLEGNLKVCLEHLFQISSDPA